MGIQERQNQQPEHPSPTQSPPHYHTPPPSPKYNLKYIRRPPASLIFWGGLLLLFSVILITNRHELPQYQESTSQIPAPSQPVQNIPQAKNYMITLVNTEREKAGVPPVSLGTNQAAQLHAEAAVKNCYSSHWDRWGLKPNHRYTLAGGTGADGENVSGHDVCTGPGDGYRPLNSLSWEVRDAVHGLMASRGHRENILHPAHTMLNVGIAHNKYNISIVQQFSSDYVTYEKRPEIDQEGILRLEASATNATFDIGNWVNIQIYYDPPPQPLTRGQLYRTYSSCSGAKVAYIVRPRSALPQGGTIDIKKDTTTKRCTDPYGIDPAVTPPTNPAEAQAERNTIKAKGLKAKEIDQTVHVIAATTLTKTTDHLDLQADLQDVVFLNGPGIYTIVMRGKPDHMQENATLSEQAIFWDIEPPQGNPYKSTDKRPLKDPD